MKTVAVTIGGKEYSATKLTVPEQCEIGRIMPALQAASRELDFPKSTSLLREMLEIVCASVRRAGSNIPLEEVTKEWAVRWPPFAAAEVLKATQTLLDFSGELPAGANLDPRANLN
jgi:hypothetical protein